VINVSNEFKNAVKGDNRQFYAGAEITLFDGTVLNLDNSKIRSLKIEDATSQDGSFTVGGVVVNKLSLTFNNFNDEYSEYDFTDAVIRPTVGLQLSETIETVNKGVFTSDSPKFRSSVITLTALDNMSKFDKPFSGVNQSYPCTAQDLLNTVCTYCGVVLATQNFDNYNYVIASKPPAIESTNCREVVSWIAQLGGNFARCNTSGALEIKWYDFEVFEQTNLDGGYFDDTEEPNYQSGDNADGGNFTNYSSGDTFDGGTFDDMSRYHHLYSTKSTPSIATDDVVITGVQVSDNSETPHTELFGQVGYIIAIEQNDLIQSQSDALAVVNFVGSKLVGVRFRPLTATVRSDPTIEAGDVAYVSTRKGTYQIFVSNVSYGVGQPMRISCDAEPPARNSATRYSAETKTYVKARETTDKKLTAYDLMVQQLNNLISHSFGFYSSEEVLPDGSKIYYKHDKPTRAESTKIWKETIDAFAVSTDGGVTYTAGFDVNGNAVFNVLSAIGINADWIRLGKLLSNDGATLIDMAFGVANSDNFSFIDNIQNGFPLTMPFNIDDSVSRINKVLLKFTQQAFRTYSTTASSGGGSSTTSSSGGGTSTSSGLGGILNALTTSATISGNTDGVVASEALPHSHPISLGQHQHAVTLDSHTHDVSIPAHTHDVSIPSHTHTLNFGIQEQAISNNEITIYVDGTLRATMSELQGIIDLTAFVTTSGWHIIEVRSSTLKRISAQINIKSYIRS
jgi:hypothetical protein